MSRCAALQTRRKGGRTLVPDVDLQLGDCLAGLRKLPSGSAHYCFTDPPYGIRYRSTAPHRYGPVLNDNLPVEQFRVWLDAVFGEISRVLGPDAALHVCAGWSTGDIILPVLKRHFTVRACIVWNKISPGISWWVRGLHEFVYFCTQGRPSPPRPAPLDIWSIPRVPVHERIHACQKPIGLVLQAMLPFTQPGQLVLDPFAGSATTAVACLQSRRRFLGWEQDPVNFERAVARVLQASENP